MSVEEIHLGSQPNLCLLADESRLLQQLDPFQRPLLVGVHTVSSSSSDFGFPSPAYKKGPGMLQHCLKDSLLSL